MASRVTLRIKDGTYLRGSLFIPGYDRLILSFKAILQEGLRLYWQNPIIILPPIILAVVSYTASSILRSLLFSSPEFFSVVISLLVGSVGLLAAFLVILGQAGMTGKVILDGHTNLGDWSASIRNHFRVVLGLGIIFGLTGVLPAILSPFTIRLAYFIAPGPLYISIRDIITTPLRAVPLSLFYLVLAPAIMEGRGIRDAFRYGLNTVRSGLGVYLPYLGIVIGISIVTLVIQELSCLSIAARAVDGFSCPGMIAKVMIVGVDTLSSPFLFILAFLIYRNKRDVLPSKENNALHPS